MRTQQTFRAILIGLTIYTTLVNCGPAQKNSDEEKRNPIQLVDVTISINETKEATDSFKKTENHNAFTTKDLIIVSIDFISLGLMVIICVCMVLMSIKDDGKIQNKVLEDGEIQKKVPEDGEIQKKVPEDGEIQKKVPEDGEIQKKVPEDGEIQKKVPEDGEIQKKVPEDGENTKEGSRG